MTSAVPPTVPLGKKLKEIRLRLGISQNDAAYLAHIDVSNFGKIERGEANPSLTTLTRIATALDTTVAELTSEITGDNVPDTDRTLTARDFIAARKAGQSRPQSRWL
ncbi:XRE family transcriptional regulator [Leucobacter sp. OH2974_COT-288]|uniref:Transcriptional regulator with XRE-family HTH domain n=1 Tax=Canibacter oris TaxID=1365628 RepID=A0A840DND4_9MICO|nr:helix-turn-helix transcriptional regulator [Canibacter oris]MBB4071049.1 transcriptional regulator with XRE-family HTH domain [Canibacter oris]RRD35453.1 XRE family transcriptional regulator [Leucobacter sp. OH2974_COT-288]